MLTRSKTAQAMNDTADMPPPSPPPAAVSQVSVAMTAASASSSRARRQRALDAKRKAAEQLADLERRKIELEEKLIRERMDFELEALDIEDHDGEISDTHSLRRPSVTSKRQEHRATHNYATATNLQTNCEYPKNKQIDQPSRLPVAPHDPPTSTESQLGKFLARQTTVKDLPSFSGAADEWLLFYSQFRATSQLCGYSDDENIARLMKCLRGEARDSVYALLTSASNLDKIIDTLKLRFGRADIIIDSMLSKIRTHKDIRQDDMTHLLKFATDIQNIVAVMVSTEQFDHLKNPVLIRDVLSKLPSNLKYQWGLDKSRRGMTDVSLEDVGEWLMEISRATAEFTSNPNLRTVDKRNLYQHRGDKHFSVMTTTNKTRECPKCKRNHDLRYCSDFLSMTVDERWNFVTLTKLCFSCLSSRHQLKNCRTRAKCGADGCERVHHRLLHAEPRQWTSNNDATVHVTGNERAEDSIIATTESNKQSCNVLLKVVRVLVIGKHGEFETSALLDEGAAVSLIDTSFAERVGIDGPTRPLRICGAHGMSSVDSTSRSVSFKVRGRKCSEVFNMYNVRTVNNLRLPVNTFHKNIVNRFDFLTDYFDVTDLTFDKVDLLIGQDNIDLIVTRKIIKGPKNGPTISQTKLGHVLHGTFFYNNFSLDVPVLHCSCEDLNEIYRKTFRTEDFGVKPSCDSPRSREDMRALEIMKATTRYIAERKRWETGLLWRDGNCRLPDSFSQAYTRLRGIRHKMVKLPEFAEKYQQKIEDYVQKGYARQLTSEEIRNKTNKTWYLPHFAVFNPNKPNKLRFVTDAAAKSEGPLHSEYLSLLPLSYIYYSAGRRTGAWRWAGPAASWAGLTSSWAGPALVAAAHAHVTAPALCAVLASFADNAGLHQTLVKGALLSSAGAPSAWLSLGVSRDARAAALLAANQLAALAASPVILYLICGRAPIPPLGPFIWSALCVSPPFVAGLLHAYTTSHKHSRLSNGLVQETQDCVASNDSQQCSQSIAECPKIWEDHGTYGARISVLLLVYFDCCERLRDAEGSLHLTDVLGTMFLAVWWVSLSAMCAVLSARLLSGRWSGVLAACSVPKSLRGDWFSSASCSAAGLARLFAVFVAPAQALLLAAMVDDTTQLHDVPIRHDSTRRYDAISRSSTI